MAHRPQWQPRFTGLRAVPRRMGLISSRGTRLSFRANPSLVESDDPRSTPSVELDGEGVQACVLRLSEVGIGSVVRLFRVSDGGEQLAVCFSVDPRWDTSPEREFSQEEVHVLFDAPRSRATSEWATLLPQGEGRAVPAGRVEKYLAHVAGWSGWSSGRCSGAGPDGRAQDVELHFLFDFERRTVRLGLCAEWPVDGMSDWGVTGWRFFGRAFPLGEGRLRLGIAGFYGDAGRVVQPDGGVEIKRVSATVSAPHPSGEFYHAFAENLCEEEGVAPQVVAELRRAFDTAVVSGMIEPERWSPCEEEPSERGGWTMPSNGERGRALICANRNAEACNPAECASCQFANSNGWQDFCFSTGCDGGGWGQSASTSTWNCDVRRSGCRKPAPHSDPWRVDQPLEWWCCAGDGEEEGCGFAVCGPCHAAAPDAHAQTGCTMPLLQRWW
mmetsp:Transcript_3718/g.12230  ORF Transcript_3718/g.12230 Transcript_3718/m.12230 type:complete len:442 (+) Transcript_3718:303-1628(+)